MMIDRKAALVSSVLVVLMLLGAVARIILVHYSPVAANLQTSLLWQILLLPLCPALLVVTLYANGRRAIAAGAKVEPSYAWGRRLSIGVCAGTLLIQSQLIILSLDFHPELISSLGYAFVLALSLLVLLAINQSPKLPWLEPRPSWFYRKFFRAGELGPIYGPRFMRANAKIWLLCLIVVIPCAFALPKHLPLYILLAFGSALLWTMALRHRYSRRWALERSSPAGVKL